MHSHLPSLSDILSRRFGNPRKLALSKHDPFEHHDHNFEWYEEQPRIWNLLMTRYEYIMLELILKVMKVIPKIVLQKIFAPVIGMPVPLPVHQVIPLESCLKLIDEFERLQIPMWAGLCPCRRIVDNWDAEPIWNYTDITIGAWGAQYAKIHPQAFRRLSYKFARQLFYRFDKAGLVHTIYASCAGGMMQAVICNCDKKVCVPLKFYNYTEKASFYTSPYNLQYDHTNCVGCKKCISYCQVNARSWNEQFHRIIIDPKKCVACGTCRNVCSNNSNLLIRDPAKSFIVIPSFLGD